MKKLIPLLLLALVVSASADIIVVTYRKGVAPRKVATAYRATPFATVQREWSCDPPNNRNITYYALPDSALAWADSTHTAWGLKPIWTSLKVQADGELLVPDSTYAPEKFQ